MQSLTLSNQNLTATIRPDLGGSLQSLVYAGLEGDIPVLRVPPAVVDNVRDAGCFAMVPFSNRIAKASLKWKGADYPLAVMGTTEEHAMHGVAWHRPWQVLEHTDTFVMLSYEHQADSAWPFAFDVSQAFELTANTLAMTLSITNQEPGPAPAGLGWHPYFAKRPNTQLTFDAKARWEMGADKLPTVLQATSGMSMPCSGLDIDNCFEGWTGVAELRDDLICTRIESKLERLVVYTKPSIDSIAIEPASHANNAINLGAQNPAELARLGVRLLPSGETFSAEMTINVRAA